MEWSTACPDWETRLRERRSIVPPPLFPDEAASGLAVLDELRVVDMPGSPTFGKVSREWVRDFAAAVFGAYDAEEGRQLIREFFLLISKKNTKSTTAGLLMLAILIRNWRTAGEFGILAPTVEVANNAYKPAADAIRADPELSKLCHVQDHIRTITHRPTKGTLQVVAADSETVAGKKWIVTLVDEVWLFGKKPNAENMLREATGGQASRDEGFVIYSSTQADEAPAGVFKQKLHYARDVRDGVIVDPQFLPVLYEFPKQMLARREYLEPENFYITNPNLGASVNEDWLRRELGKAQSAGPESMPGFLAKHLNVEIGLSLRSDRWAGADFWLTCGTAPGMTLAQLLARCEVVDAGIDGGGLDDLLALAFVGREKGTRRWLVWCRAWAHPSVLERRKSEAARFRDFAADGDLVLVEEIGQDIEQLVGLVHEVYRAGLLDKIGVDPYGIGMIVEALVDSGVPEELVIGISQGWKMSGAIKTLERRLAEGEVEHAAQPLLAWAVGNAKVVPQGNAVAITKANVGAAKIDPLMAVLDAVNLLALNPEAPMREYDVAFV